MSTLKLAITLVSCLTVALLATSCRGYESAQKAYALGEYEKAAKLFDATQRAEENKFRKAEECFLMGECYRRLGMTSKAASAYQRAVRLKYDDDIALLHLADCYRALGKFDEATDAYNAYADKHKTDLRVGVGRESTKMAKSKWAELNPNSSGKVDSGYVVKPFSELNSKYSDFCPAFVGDGFDVVYFSSMRFQKKKKKANKITGQANSTIYMSRVDARGKWTEPEPLDEPFGQKGNDDGVAYVAPDGRTMLFTRCPLNNQEGSPAQSYEMKREGGRWSDPVRITPGGDSTMMVAHPTLSPDGQTLFFVSDREEGSVGGLDIWKSLRNVDGSWGPAQNLGAIVNSKGDEMFPYVRQDGTLYFSSNGHRGFGGLDIFKATEREDGRYDVVNMGLPINSTGDDFGIAFMGNAEEGLLSSNRGSSKGYDDIYSFYLPPVILTIEARVGQSGRKAFASAPAAASSATAQPSEPAPSQAKKSTATSSQKSTTKKKTTTSNKKKSTTSNNKKQAAKTSTSKSSTTKKKKEFIPAPDAFVRIVGSDGTNVKLKASDSGTVSFLAEKNVNYIILFGAPGFANKRTEVSTEGLNKTQTLTVTTLLDKVE